MTIGGLERGRESEREEHDDLECAQRVEMATIVRSRRQYTSGRAVSDTSSARPRRHRGQDVSDAPLGEEDALGGDKEHKSRCCMSF